MDVFDSSRKKVETNFRFAQVIVLESLRPEERATGREVEHAVRMSFSGHPSLGVERRTCGTKRAFVDQLTLIEQEAAGGVIPLLHIESHGHQNDGLQFADGKFMPWPTLADRLNRINLLTGFNLMVVISACFGAYLNSVFSGAKPCPCWGIVAPTQTAYEDELENGFAAFYGALATNWDLGEALDTLKSRKLRAGEWHSETAEDWFWKLITGYLDTYCRIEDSDQWARDIRLKRELLNRPYLSLRDLKEVMRQSNQNRIRDYFRVFFQTDSSERISEKFEPFRREFFSHIDSLTQSRLYLL